MAKQVIGIIDYGVGNTGSITNMITRIGGRSVLVYDEQSLLAADKLILPGVGSFENGMNMLSRSGLIGPLKAFVHQSKRPLLGICLGMQLLTFGSEEGEGLGLGFIEGKAKHFPRNHINLKVPHMGWNTITVIKKNPLLNISQPQDQRFYFAHSFFVECDDETDVVARSEYGLSFVSAFQKENVYGVQFHPEKSHRYGMALIKQFSQI